MPAANRSSLAALPVRWSRPISPACSRSSRTFSVFAAPYARPAIGPRASMRIKSNWCATSFRGKRVAKEGREEVKVDLRLLAARGYSLEPASKAETDRVFVHDLILPVFIGAYDFERGKTQRVRFCIDVDIRRSTHHAEDMRDVFSYDVVVDAIRLILSRGHVDLVETLAERIADALLAYPRVCRVIARVEKLDVIEGRVGIEITRERAAESGKLHQLLPAFRISPRPRPTADAAAETSAAHHCQARRQSGGLAGSAGLARCARLLPPAARHRAGRRRLRGYRAGHADQNGL